jgi:hypothetical protein
MSIVVGLGITRILSDFASIAEHRAQVTLDGLTILWAINVLGYHLIYWWVVVNNWRTRETWTFLGFAALFLYGVALYFCAALILPRASAEKLDLKERYESIRLPFFYFWLVVASAEVLDSVAKGLDYVFESLGLPYLFILGTTFLFSVTAIRVRDRRFHWFFGLATFIGTFGWVLFRFSEI